MGHPVPANHPLRRHSGFHIERMNARRVLVDGHYWSKAQLARELGLKSSSTVANYLKQLKECGLPVTLSNLRQCRDKSLAGISQH